MTQSLHFPLFRPRSTVGVFVGAVAALLVFGAPQTRAAHDYVELKTVVLIYPDYHYELSPGDDYDFHATVAQIEQIRDAVLRNCEYYWRASHCRFLVTPTFYVMRDASSGYGFPSDPDMLEGVARTLDFDQIHNMGGSAYWLKYYSNDGVHSVQKDLEDLGYEESSVGSVMVYFAFQRHAGIDAYGGGAAAWPYRDNPNNDPCLLTSAAYWAMEIQDGWLTLDNGNMPASVCQHEFSHNMDQIFAASYISPTRDGADLIPHHGDYQDTMQEPFDVHSEYQQICHTSIDEADWFTLDSYWATAHQATDADNDGVPDYGDFPVTEATLGTSTSSADTDRDGLTDAEELVPGAWYYIFQGPLTLDPTDPDTDGDGVVDGADPYPLVPGDTVIINNTPTINGVIGANEYVQIAAYSELPSTGVTAYAAYDNDTLYLGFDVTDDVLYTSSAIMYWNDHLVIHIDVDNDGYMAGEKNYEVLAYKDPSSNNVVFELYQDYRYYDSFSGSILSREQLTPVGLAGTCVVSGSQQIYEIAIPESDLPGAAFDGDTSFSIAVAYRDTDAGADGDLCLMNGVWGDNPDFITCYLDDSGDDTITLLDDDFENGNFAYWTDGGATDWDLATSQYYSSSHSAHAGSSDNDLVSDNLDASGMHSMRISFWYREDDIDDSDDVFLQLYNGSEYVDEFELGVADAEDTWTYFERVFYNAGDDAQFFISNFRIKFAASSIDYGENLWIDDVLVTVNDGPPGTGPATFSTDPYWTNNTTVTMTATQLSDQSGVVEYYFEELSANAGANDSGWTANRTYTDSGLTPGLTYTYRVRARDAHRNVAYGSELIKVIPGGSLPTPTPRPSPAVASFASAPAQSGVGAVSMTASVPAGSSIQYYFDEVSGNPGGDDSGWTISQSYTDSGLEAGYVYQYTVLTRSGGVPEQFGYPSAVASVELAPPGTPPSPTKMTWSTTPYSWSNYIIGTAVTATGDGDLIYRFVLEDTTDTYQDIAFDQSSPMFYRSVNSSTWRVTVQAFNDGAPNEASDPVDVVVP